MATKTPDQIWSDDLFARRGEAELLLAYIESVIGSDMHSGGKAYTIAIEAPYGEGKSFFLQRLAEHIGINSPTAFIDAWSDDLSDDPLIALAATLNRALEPYTATPSVAAGLKSFLAKSGKVAWIASKGLAKRAVGLAITAAATDAIVDVISETAEATQAVVGEGIKDAVDATLSPASEPSAADAQETMEKRIALFNQGKAAVQQFKESLREIVEAISDTDKYPPVVIIIDELDRCRPTYAIKLLEEIKHLFDVPGLLFIIAINGEQLGHSISGSYGTNFDGRAYLHRFIDREYRLNSPNLQTLLEHLCETYGLNGGPFKFDTLAIDRVRELETTLPVFISTYMHIYGMSARDAFRVIDILRTSAVIAQQGSAIILAYFLPLVFAHIRALPPSSFLPVVNETKIVLPIRTSVATSWTMYKLDDLARQIANAVAMTIEELQLAADAPDASYPVKLVWRSRVHGSGPKPLWSIERYPDLLRTVGRFQNPQLKDDS